MPTARREFQVMVKPGGAVCNLACTYCYYLSRDALYPAGEPRRMPDDLLERYIVQHLEACPTPLVSFAWHGGEPTVLGLDYFRQIVALQRTHRPAGRRIVNGIQTNGVLIDEAWARFLAAEGFYAGLSLDGPAELHDRHRVTRGQRPTHREAMRALHLFQQHRVQHDVLCVLHADNVRHPARVYRFFRDAGVRQLQFLPLVERRPDGTVGERTAPAEAYGAFLCAVFDAWVRHDVGRIVIQAFDEALRPALGLEHALCVVRETCGDVPVLEHTGDFYACDHFVDPAHRFGNIRDTHLADLVESPAQRAFGEAKRDALPPYCRACDVRAWCNGGCPKDRFLRTPEGEPGLNYLCAGFQRFFRHTRPYWEAAAALLRAGKPIEVLMERVRAADARARAQAGRNDPCPCGSGQKFKRCCLR
jgi:uncharacterized protein